MVSRLLATLALVSACISSVGCDSSKSDWLETEQEGTLEAYEQFLAQHPESKYAEKAQQHIEALEWERAVESNTREAIDSFLVSHQEGAYVDSAHERIEQWEWSELVRLNTTTEAYERFLSEEYLGDRSLDEFAVQMLETSLKGEGGIRYRIASLFKIGPHLYEALESEDTLHSLPEGSHALGFDFFRFPIDKPVALKFNSFVKVVPIRKSWAPFSVTWEQPPSLTVTALEEPSEDIQLPYGKAYNYGVVENGILLAGFKHSGGKLDVITAAEAGLRNIVFNIPDSLGGVQIKIEGVTLLISRGVVAGNRVFMESGFRVIQDTSGRAQVEKIRRKVYEFERDLYNGR